MSEPRNKAVAQETVARFYEGVCAAVHRVDNRMPCVVGPTPYYKVWQLNGSMILRNGDGSPMKGIVYTFDFYDPWDFVTSDAEDGYAYPDECAALCLTQSTRAIITITTAHTALSYTDRRYPCSVAFRGWVPLFCPRGGSQIIRVDRSWLRHLLDAYPIALSREADAPVFCNQWGVKRSVTAARGRLAYAEDVAPLSSSVTAGAGRCEHDRRLDMLSPGHVRTTW